VLSEVGVRQPLQEVRELAESAYSLRADALRDLPQRCSSVRYCVGLWQHTMDDAIAGAPAQYVPRLKRLTSVLDVYKILYKVK
jgi:hypothetical protein